MKRNVLWITIISIFVTSCFVLRLNNSITIEERLNQKNLIVVQPDYTYPDKIAFDLENESFFTTDLAQAVKNGKFYEGYRHVSNNGKERFDRRKKYTLYYPLIATKITKKEIQKSNFKVRQKVDREIQEMLEELRPYLAPTKMIVIYNKDYLPVEVKLYDTVNQKWTMFAKYSYPYKNRKEYEKELNECIEAVLNGDFGEV